MQTLPSQHLVFEIGEIGGCRKSGRSKSGDTSRKSGDTIPIEIGGQYIRTGDWIVGDDDGVVVISQERVVEVANRAQTVVEREEREMAEIEEGDTLGRVSELMRWEQLRKKGQ